MDIFSETNIAILEAIMQSDLEKMTQLMTSDPAMTSNVTRKHLKQAYAKSSVDFIEYLLSFPAIKAKCDRRVVVSGLIKRQKVNETLLNKACAEYPDFRRYLLKEETISNELMEFLLQDSTIIGDAAYVLWDMASYGYGFFWGFLHKQGRLSEVVKRNDVTVLLQKAALSLNEMFFKNMATVYLPSIRPITPSDFSKCLDAVVEKYDPMFQSKDEFDRMVKCLLTLGAKLSPKTLALCRDKRNYVPIENIPDLQRPNIASLTPHSHTDACSCAPKMKIIG